ncbi:MAG: hypothetical protein JRM86_00270 [Nitrososphaerota archaeon]|nr:hypothetical protein [Nitrososphaerota archaeon]
MAYERTITVAGRQYRQLVESVWDPKARVTRKHLLRHLGPVQPAHPRGVEPPHLPLPPVHFGLLATRIMTGTLTAAQIVELVEQMGGEVPPGDLQAVGIRYDLGEKTLELLLWPAPPSASRPAVRSAGAPRRSKGRTPPRPSRSRERGG